MELGKAVRAVHASQAQQVAMEPSFWSWEKPAGRWKVGRVEVGCNGAQLLELGKADLLRLGFAFFYLSQWSPAFGAGKRTWRPKTRRVLVLSQWSPAFGAGKRIQDKNRGTEYLMSQWSPAFGAGKSRGPLDHRPRGILVAMEPSFWSWEKPDTRPTRWSPTN